MTAYTSGSFYFDSCIRVPSSESCYYHLLRGKDGSIFYRGIVANYVRVLRQFQSIQLPALNPFKSVLDIFKLLFGRQVLPNGEMK